MKNYPSSELKQNLGDVLAAAAQEPVSITRHNKPRFVLMSIEAYETHFSKDVRQAYTVEEAPDEHIRMIENYAAELEGE